VAAVQSRTIDYLLRRRSWAILFAGSIIGKQARSQPVWLERGFCTVDGIGMMMASS